MAGMDRVMDEVLAKHLTSARDDIAAAEAMIGAGRAKITEGQEQVLAGERAAETARTRLAVMEDLVDKLRRDLASVTLLTPDAASASAATSSAATDPAALSSQANGRRKMGPVMDEIMGDGEEHTIDEIHAVMERRGHNWSRASVMNHCADRARRGVFVRRVREDGRSAYKLAASSGDQLPSGPASPEGGRVPQPEGDSRNGSGQVQETGSLAI
jgi:hypothetical protein